MSAGTMATGTRLEHAEPVIRAPSWVVGRRFDLAFFLLPPLGTALFLAAQALFPAAAFALAAAVWVGLAQSHFGATLLFYLDRQNRHGFRARPVVYFAVPLALVVAGLALGLAGLGRAVLLAVPLGSFWHGNRQSIGVAGLYRGLTGNFDAWSRGIESLAIFAGSACFTVVGVVRLGMLGDWGVAHSALPPVLVELWWLALALAAALLGVALVRAHRQCRAARVAPWPRLALLSSSWAMYLPYVLAADVLSAYLAALIPHYLQYHGLVWRVNRNKAEAGALAGEALLPALVSSPRRYVAGTVGFAALLGAVLTLCVSAGRTELGLAVVAGVNLAHFWLDGFFWRYRDPLARARTLRFIRRP